MTVSRICETRRFILLASLLCVIPVCLRAQAPSGPLPSAPTQPPSSSAADKSSNAPVEVQPRTSIMGAWRLNRDESDDARKKLQDARRSGAAGSNRGGGVRLGIPGMGGGPYGGRRGGQGGRESEQDREHMQEFLAPANLITLTRKDPEIDLVDDQNRKLALFTDGRKLEKSKDANNQQIAAHWDGNRLVTDEKNPRGGKMSRTYELSYDGKQLYETLNLTMGRSNSPVSIRYVYDPSGGKQAQTRP